jgi:hypothetical protein
MKDEKRGTTGSMPRQDISAWQASIYPRIHQSIHQTMRSPERPLRLYGIASADAAIVTKRFVSRFNLTVRANLDSLRDCSSHGVRAVSFFMSEGYCVKCKTKRPIADGVEETMKNGRKAIKGKCPVCGTVMFKILGKAAAGSPPAAPTPITPPPQV